MNVIFTGDIAIPETNATVIDAASDLFKDKIVVGNLEGPIIEPSENNIIDDYKFNLFSTPESIELLKHLNYSCFSLANNHISDFRNGIESTIKLLDKYKIDHFGLKSKSSTSLITSEKEIELIGTCTRITGGNIIRKNPINTFNPRKTLKLIRSIRERKPKSIIILFIHWGYELAPYPQPADRSFAKKSIEAGADFIIGHHPHVVQGIESYKNGHIFYSLGNFYLPQTSYLNKTLKYKSERVLEQIVPEYITSENKFIVHWFKYDKEENKLVYIEQSNLNSKRLAELTPYKNLSDREYCRWFQEEKKKMDIENNTSRYPTFTNYLAPFNIQLRMYNTYFTLYQLLRKILIKIKLHKPYNW